MAIFRTRDRQPLYCRVIGHGTPVIMLHGVGMHGGHWLPFVLPHLHRFCFYLPDFRGAGKSAAIPVNQPDLFENLAQDIEDLIAHFQLTQVLLVGYSLGGSVALHLHKIGGFRQVRQYLHMDQTPCLYNQPDWPHGLLGVKQAAFFARLDKVRQQLTEYAKCADLLALPRPTLNNVMPDLCAILAIAAGNPSLTRVLRQAARFPRLFARFFGRMTVHNLLAYLEGYACHAQDYRPQLAQMDIPVTLFVGRKSQLYSATGQLDMAARLPQVRVVVFEQSGHLLQVDEPRKYAREFRHFLWQAL